MQDSARTNQALLEEIANLKQRIKSLEQSEIKFKERGDTLQESDERFRSLVDATSDWIWEINTEGVYTYASPKIKDLLGYEPEDIIGKTPFDMMPADTAEHMASVFKEISESRRPFSGLENMNVHKDGRVIILETAGVPIIDARGNYLGYRGFDRDITERKQAENSLRKSEEKYRQLAETAHDLIVTADLDFRITYVNKATLNFTGGIDPVGMRVLDFTRQHLHQLQEERMQKRREGFHEVMNFEWEIISPAGETAIFDTRSTLLTENGKPAGVMYIIRDITERKKMEMALKESDERFRSLFEHSIDGVFIHDFEGNFLDVNQPMIDAMGYDRNELLSMNISSVLGEEQTLKAGKIIEELLQTGRQQKPVEYEVKCKDGGHLYCENNHSVIYHDGKPHSILGVARNITDRKKAEEVRERLISELENALSQVKKLSGLLPICAGCKKIRDDKGYWNQLESYISSHSDADFSHGICPDCAQNLYPKLFDNK